MPRRDGTGPMGMGSRTGRGMGFCNSTKTSGATRGLGLGWRRGCRGGFFTNLVNSQSEKDLLMEEKTFLENRLNSVNNQLNTL